MFKKIKLRHVLFISLGLMFSYGSVQAMNFLERSKIPEYFYSKIDDNYDNTIEVIRDTKGKEITKGKEYNLLAYNEFEDKIKVPFVLTTEDPNQLLEQGIYLKIEIKENEIINIEKIMRDDVPINIVKILE